MSMFRPVVLLSRLREDQELAYEAAHRTIPDDLFQLLAGAGVRDWAIWRDGRSLLHLVDVDDYDAMAEQIGDDPVNDRWQTQMAAYVEGFDEVDSIPVLTAPRLVWSMRRQASNSTFER